MIDHLIHNLRRDDDDASLEQKYDSFKYSEYKMCDYENKVDPENNYYNDLALTCKYFTDSQFNNDVYVNNVTKTIFSLIHFNVRGLSANFGEIQDYLQSLKMKFDVIAITETWLDGESMKSEYI